MNERIKMFAVVKTGGKQYRVVVGQVLSVERLSGEAGDKIELNQVLLVSGDETATIGAPFVENAVVSAEIVAQSRGPKVIAFKKRRRQNSKRTRGHRQDLSTIRIVEIVGTSVKSKKNTPKKVAKTVEVAAE
ncbi:50S ribosomal protein L21 [Bartonella sp. DGB2]|uniref:50S ribosomal protein L21 n=1 Tax=Bartonella sp. DGB2 TaxID=3388426 RepID=UPI00398FD236